MHADTESIQRLIHAELPTGDAARLRAHLDQCGECRGRHDALAQEERNLDRLLARLDHQRPPVDLDRVLERARRPAWAGRRLAASLVLSAGIAGAAYALPGSPLPGWWRVAREWIVGADSVPPPQSPGGVSAGVAVIPGERLTIEFVARQDSGMIELRLWSGPEVTLRAADPRVTFLTGPGRITVDNRGARAGYRVDLPRDAALVELRVEGMRILLKAGPRLEPALASDATGVYRLSLDPVPAP